MPHKLVRANRKERHCEFKLVVLGVKRLRIVLVQVFKHCIDDEVRLTKRHELQELERSVAGDENDDD